MLPLLRYTLDLFGVPAPEDSTPAATKTRASVPPAATPPAASGASAVFQHPQANRRVQLPMAHIGYRFQRARRKTIGFVVGPQGLEVRAPRWTPLAEVDAALHEKAVWIVRKLQETQARQRQLAQSVVAWGDGAVFPYLGAPLQVRLGAAPGYPAHGALHLAHGSPEPTQPSAPGGVGAEGGPLPQLWLALPAQASADQVRDAAQAWVMRQAHAHFENRLNHFAPLLQVRWTRLALSQAQTRWGSAKADGSIRLNWRLMHFRPSVIDYVVAHELSHLRVMDHSPRFWDTVRSVVPDYAVLCQDLKHHTVPPWS